MCLQELQPEDFQIVPVVDVDPESMMLVVDAPVKAGALFCSYHTTRQSNCGIIAKKSCRLLAAVVEARVKAG